MSANAHYKTRPLKRVSTINDDALPEITDPDYLLRYVDISNVDELGDIHAIVEYRFEDAPSRARRIVREGDVIISTVRTYLQAIAPIISPPENLIVSTGFAVIRPKPSYLKPAFCKYALRESYFLHEVMARSVGVSYPAINASELGIIPIPIPPLPEQQAIADFLDRETVKIDHLIAKKQRLLELLAEKRQTLITHAVTKGLDPDASMKDSGIEWLGEIPAVWEVMRLKNVVVLENNRTTDWSNEIYIGLENIESWTGKLIPSSLEETFDEEVENRSIANIFDEGDVLFGKLRPYLAKVYLAKLSGFCTTELLVMTPRRRIKAKFLLYSLLNKTVVNLVESSTYGAKMPRANWDTIANISLPIPSLDDQQAICDYLDRKIASIDALIEKTGNILQLLSERRASLISDTVTGKIRLTE